MFLKLQDILYILDAQNLEFQKTQTNKRRFKFTDPVLSILFPRITGKKVEVYVF